MNDGGTKENDGKEEEKTLKYVFLLSPNRLDESIVEVVFLKNDNVTKDTNILFNPVNCSTEYFEKPALEQMEYCTGPFAAQLDDSVNCYFVVVAYTQKEGESEKWVELCVEYMNRRLHTDKIKVESENSHVAIVYHYLEGMLKKLLSDIDSTANSSIHAKNSSKDPAPQ